MLISAYNYKAWADLRTHRAIRQIDDQSPTGAIEFCQQQLNHMCIVEELFRARLLGANDPHQATNTNLLPPLNELEERQTAGNAWFTSYIAELDATAHDEAIRFVFADGKNGRMTRQEMLFHVLNHGTYHRGAISQALDRSGVAHPVDGYATFAHANEPERRA